MNRAQPPSTLGRYRLVKVLGKGAMGVVYEALDPRLSRTVAIKTILKSHLVDDGTAEEYSRRFETEAQAAARLNHPNIVTVFDFGEQDDVSFIVMEFVRGRELAQAFDAGESFTLAEAVRVMGELLDALAFAHGQRVVHRDVKPANVMLDDGGRVKLTDFGVARVASHQGDRTMPGTMVGTPSYMAPEQILGLAVGSRADLFAAGVILYQFLTGQRPFAGGGTFAVQRRIVNDPAMPPSTLNPALPPLFDDIVARALAKQPEDRYVSAQDFAADLRRALGAVPSHSVDLDLHGDAGESTNGSLRLPRQGASIDPGPRPAAPSAAPSAAPAAPPPASPTAPLPSGLTTIRPARPPVVEDDDDATRPPPRPWVTPAPVEAPPERAAPGASPIVPPPASQPPAPAPTAPPVRSASPPPPASKPPQPRERGPAAAPELAPDRRWLLGVVGSAGAALLVLVLWVGLSAKPPVTSSRKPAPAEAQPASVTLPPVMTPTAASPGPASAATLSVSAPLPAAASKPTSASAPTAPPKSLVAPVTQPPREARKPAAAPPDRLCSELLQRMQLGEPLSPEQSATFQRDCTRR